MATADNFLNMTQNFFTPDILQKFSGALGQPVDKIQSGLKSVLPTFLMGVANKGSTTEGAQSLVNMVKREGFDSAATPANLTDETYLKKGNAAVNGIFGNNLNSVTSTLSSSTGMNSSIISKMMGLIAPMAMGALGSKIKRENLNASGVSNFLGQQKSTLARFLPAGLTGFLGGQATNVGAAATSVRHTVNRPSSSYAARAERVPLYAEKRKPWALLGLILLVLLGLFWWITSRRNVQEAVRPVASITTTTTTQRVPTDILTEAAPSVTGIVAYLKAGDENTLPKRFAFENLVFETGTANLSIDAQSELDEIATSMKNYPQSTARIEGFTDNTGDAAANLDLSNARANAVKDQLVERGIDASRIEAIGRGSEAPVASNNDEAGRGRNRRIEFIITNIK